MKCHGWCWCYWRCRWFDGLRLPRCCTCQNLDVFDLSGSVFDSTETSRKGILSSFAVNDFIGSLHRLCLSAEGSCGDGWKKDLGKDGVLTVSCLERTSPLLTPTTYMLKINKLSAHFQCRHLHLKKEGSYRPYLVLLPNRLFPHKWGRKGNRYHGVRSSPFMAQAFI